MREFVQAPSKSPAARLQPGWLSAASNPPWWEPWAVAIFLCGFLIFNLCTATRYPVVWSDEVMYADPAVNLVMGNGFTSTAWYVQSSNEFWAGNVPLHSALLWPWLKVFGVSITAVRSINYFYLAASCLLLWRNCLRLGLVGTTGTRLLLLALVAGGYSFIFSYRSGRPDCLPLLLVCLFLYAHTLRRTGPRHLAFLLLGMLSPWAGLQLLPLLAVGGALLALYLGRAFWTQLFAAWAGAALGVATLVMFYVAHGVFGQFLKTVRQHTSVGFFAMLARGEFRHSNLLPKDFSFWFLFLLALLLALHQLRQGRFRLKSALSFGLVYSIVLSVALVVSGKFPTYYGWMTCLPLAVCLCATLSEARPTGLLRLAYAALLTLAIGSGVLLHGAAAGYNWRDRDYGHVTALVRENASREDWLLGEFSTYYAAKPLAAKTFMPTYLPVFSDAEKARLTILVLAPGSLNEVTNVIGGEWVPTGKGFTPEKSGFLGSKRDLGFLTTQDYRLEVYRRKNPTP